jgi:hypothetical protein
VLVVDKTWAKLYRSAIPPAELTLVYHQALFGGRPPDDEDLARGLCRLLRADRQTGKYTQLVMLASREMLAALRRQYDGDWENVLAGRIEDLPARYGSEDLEVYVRHVLARQPLRDDPGAGTTMVKTED